MKEIFTCVICFMRGEGIEGGFEVVIRHKLTGRKRQRVLLNFFKTGKLSCTGAGKVISYFRSARGIERKGRIQKNGYELIGIYLYKSSKYLWVSTHQLIYLYFWGEYDSKMQINHIDGNKLNNSITNLELVTSSENHLHALRLGFQLPTRGSKNGGAKLTEEEVKKIKFLLLKGEKQNKLASIFKVSKGTINSISLGHIWKHVS